MHELIKKTAVEVVGLLKKGEVTPLELLEVMAARVSDVDGGVNALPTLAFDQAKEAVKANNFRDSALAGLPIVIKDLTETAGIKTTYGSPIFKDNVPDTDNVLVENLKAAGGVIAAKSNTPEFGAGANTFNEVFGITRNPYDTRLTCAGSSGGSAVALATGEAWLGQGSDLGGSLRTPASFCGIYGMRPSPGRVAVSESSDAFDPLPVHGPMARTVQDLALNLDAMAVYHPGDPLSYDTPATSYLSAAQKPEKPKRVAFTLDFGGIIPFEALPVEAVKRAVDALDKAGVDVVEHTIDFSKASDTFQTLRAAGFATGIEPLLEAHRDLLKPEVIWNVEKGLKQSVTDVARANRQRTAMQQAAAQMFNSFDLFLCPAACVAPFPVEQRYIERIGDVVFDNYVDWLAPAFAITVLGLPAVVAPTGIYDGLPAGVQLVGGHRGEARLLSHTAFLENALNVDLAPVEPNLTHT